MRIFTVGEFKTIFSQILEWVKEGEEIAIKKKKKRR